MTVLNGLEQKLLEGFDELEKDYLEKHNETAHIDAERITPSDMEFSN